MDTSREHLRRADGALCYRAAAGKKWPDRSRHRDRGSGRGRGVTGAATGKRGRGRRGERWAQR